MPLTAGQNIILDVVTRLVGSISLVTCVFVVVAYFIFPPFTNSVVSRLALTIAVADLISVSSETLGRLGMSSPSLCQCQAFGQQFGELVAVFIIVAIAVNLILVVKLDFDFDDIRAYDKAWIPLSVVVAGAMASVPIFTKAYGNSGLWCWITDARFKWLLYGPLFAAVVFVAVTSIVVHFDIKDREQEDAMFTGISVDDPSISALPGVVWLYLIVFLLTWGPIVAIGVFRVFQPHGSEMAIHVALAVFLPLRGFFDSAVAFYQAWRSRKWRSKMREAGLKEGGKGEWWEDLDAKLVNRISLVWK